MITIDCALSIGPTCAAAFHLRRRFKRHAVRGVFDWQVTPVDALIRYLQADFTGLMELPDLEQWPSVRNKRFDTLHPHEFPVPVQAAYPAAYDRHLFLCQQTRLALRGNGRVLLQASEAMHPMHLVRIEDAVRRYSPKLKFTLQNGPARPPDGEDWRGSETVWDGVLSTVRVSTVTRVRKRAAIWLNRDRPGQGTHLTGRFPNAGAR